MSKEIGFKMLGMSIGGILNLKIQDLILTKNPEILSAFFKARMRHSSMFQ